MKFLKFNYSRVVWATKVSDQICVPISQKVYKYWIQNLKIFIKNVDTVHNKCDEECHNEVSKQTSNHVPSTLKKT